MGVDLWLFVVIAAWLIVCINRCLDCDDDEPVTPKNTQPGRNVE